MYSVQSALARVEAGLGTGFRRRPATTSSLRPGARKANTVRGPATGMAVSARRAPAEAFVLPDDNSIHATISASDMRPIEADLTDNPVSVVAPTDQKVPLVFASPHSGAAYPDSFVDQARLDPLTLRRSEDAFVDEIFAAASDHGAPMLKAHFPRAYVDPNREPYELDPRMFADVLPQYVNTASPRVAAGLGTIARVVTSGDDIYRDKLTFTEAKRRIDTCYIPYHETLSGLVEETRRRFGACLLIDCHSMPSVGGPMDRDPGLKRVNMVLGDGHGSTCAETVVDLAEATLAGLATWSPATTPMPADTRPVITGAPRPVSTPCRSRSIVPSTWTETAVARGNGLTP